MVTRTVQTQREFLIYTACSDIGQHARDDENHRQKTRRPGEQSSAKRLSSSRRAGINWRLLSATAANCLPRPAMNFHISNVNGRFCGLACYQRSYPERNHEFHLRVCHGREIGF